MYKHKNNKKLLYKYKIKKLISWMKDNQTYEICYLIDKGYISKYVHMRE